MTPKREKRIKTIEDFSGLGSGFHIAMKDLDIRGAGNMLGEGTRQLHFGDRLRDLPADPGRGDQELKEEVSPIPSMRTGVHRLFVRDVTVDTDARGYGCGNAYPG